ncbi:class I SAM-dependent methyltransferase [Rodentibacter caecimuris]|uniref:class I SAM-dependent methyltransferase n=1 Tax=Rodentibacter caecimuris TaxID=1796644 RepID=UPI0009875C70|nr:methyltransferase [Rodentibacter heylii]
MTNQQPIDYIFSSDWFSHNLPSLNAIFNHLKPQKILEIGSFEGRSTVHFLEKALEFHQEIEMHCIDSWEGGREHIGHWDMNSVENCFEHNLNLVLQKLNNPQIKIAKHKGYSHPKMIELLANGYSNYFDFVYVDGSHEAPDVLLDALLAHKLTKINGIIAFDDYLWSPTAQTEEDHYLLVKPAVDHYVNTYQRKVHVLQGLPGYQLYVKKLTD